MSLKQIGNSLMIAGHLDSDGDLEFMLPGTHEPADYVEGWLNASDAKSLIEHLTDVFKLDAGMQTLAEYIDEHYDGNQSAFGRDFGIIRAIVHQYLNAKKPVYVADGKLVQVIRELEKF